MALEVRCAACLGQGIVEATSVRGASLEMAGPFVTSEAHGRLRANESAV